MNADEVVMFSLDEIELDLDTQLDLTPWADEELATALQSLDRLDAPN